MSRLLIDLDGVVVNSSETWLREYRAISGDPLYPAQLSEYAFDKLAKYPKLIWTALTTGDVFRTSLPYEGAIDTLRWLNSQHEVYIVTYSHESVRDGHRAKLDWLAHWAPFIAERQVVFTRDKFLVEGDYLIEDNSANLYGWLSESATRGSRQGILIDQTYNKKTVLDMLETCVRVGTFSKVVEVLK